MLRRRLLALLASGPALASAPPARKQERQKTRRITLWAPQVEPGQTPAWKALLEGKEVRVARSRGPQDELLILVVLDVTGDLTLVEPGKQALIAEIERLPKSAWVGVLRAQDGLRVLADPGADRAAAVAAIQGAQVSGRAGLMESVESAAGLATRIIRKSPLRVAVVYLTDSNIYNYREDYTNPVINPSDQRDLSRRFPEVLVREKTAALAEAVSEYDAPVFVVHLAWLRDRLNEAYQTGLQQIAEASGGESVFCRTLGDIPDTVTRTFERIRAMWALDVEIPTGTGRSYTLMAADGGGEVQHKTRFSERAGGKEE